MLKGDFSFHYLDSKLKFSTTDWEYNWLCTSIAIDSANRKIGKVNYRYISFLPMSNDFGNF